MNQRRYGTLLSYVSILLNLFLGMLFTPFLVKTLGKEEYGLYTIVGALIANLAIIDLGLADSVVRFVARYRTHQDKDGEERFLGLISIMYTVVAIAALGVGAFLISRVPVIFGRSMSPNEIQGMQLMMTVMVANSAVTFLFNAVGATLVAYERFVLLRCLEIGTILLSTAAMIAVLKMGHKAFSIVVVTAVTNTLVILTKVFYAFFVLKVRLKFAKPEMSFVKEIFKYSSSIFVVVVVEQIYWKLDSIILGAMMGASVVAVYSIGLSFNKYFMSFGTAISKVLMPKVVRRVEQGADAKELTDLLITVSRVQSIVLLPILVGLIMFGREFIHLWMGPDYSIAYLVMLATIVPFSLDLMGNIRNQIMQAKGIYWYRSITILIIATCNIGVTFLFIKLFGMVGAAISTGLGLLIGNLAVNTILRVKVGIDVFRYWRELWSGLLPAVLVSGLAAFMLNQVPGSSWGLLAAKGLVYGAAYAIAVWYIGMRPSERRMIKELHPAYRAKAVST